MIFIRYFSIYYLNLDDSIQIKIILGITIFNIHIFELNIFFVGFYINLKRVLDSSTPKKVKQRDPTRKI